MAVATALVPEPADARPAAPVVMLVFDELPLVSLLDRNGHIDPVRYPNLAALARGSTWYPNATTVSDSTKTAIPSILDGRTPDGRKPATARAHPDTLFTLLHRQGYRLRVEEEATDLCPYRGCRRNRTVHYLLNNKRIDRFKRFVARLGGGPRRTFYYKHVLLPHVPWIYTPTLRRYDRTVNSQIGGLNSHDRSVFDPTLVHQSWQRHLLQVGAVDTLIGGLVTRMKKTGLYDRAELVVIGDHGVSFRVGATDRRAIVPANAFDIAPIPLLMKAPRQRRGRVDRAMVRTYDVLPTIAHTIGLRLPRGLDGRAAGHRAVRRRRQVKVLSRNSVGKVTFSLGRLLAGRRAALGRKLSLFGSGRRSLYATGPAQRLRGRALADLAVARRGRVRATLNYAKYYRRVFRGSNFVPTHVTGRITGGRRGARRPIAVTVNGRVWGLTRSAHIRGSSAEYYTVMISPAVLAPGRNSIGVFSVGRRGGRYLLRRLR